MKIPIDVSYIYVDIALLQYNGASQPGASLTNMD